MFSTSLIMGFFKVPNLMTTQGRPMPKTDLKILTASACVTLIALIIGLRYVPNKSNYAKGLLLASSLGCVLSSARVIEDSRRRCKL
jgi:hypothetical protein